MENGLQQCDICIVCALTEEAEAVRNEFSARCQVIFEKAISARSGYVYYHTTIQNQQDEALTILLSCQTYPGPIETIDHLNSLLNEFQPRFVAMTGICAGDKLKVQLGDLIVAEYAYHYEEGKVEKARDGTVTLHPAANTYGPAKRILQYAHNLKTWQQAVAERQRLKRKRTRKNTAEPQCFIAPMASGMAVRGDNPFSMLQQQQRKTLALDQEAAAFYKTLHEEFSHIFSLVVKGVCDHADSAKNDMYHEEAAHASAIYLLSFIQEYVTQETMPRRTSPYHHQQIVQIKSNHIAAPPGKMFDRTGELAEIQRCLLNDRDIRGIFLWGGRGCGKSVIAKKIAENCMTANDPLGKRFTHIVWLTFRKEELTTTGIAKPYNFHQSKHEIYSEILQVHGQPYLGNKDPLRGVQEVLRNTRTLVILDSFEFFLEGKEELDNDLAALLSEVALGSCFFLTSSCNSDEIGRYAYKIIKVAPFDADTAKNYFLHRWSEKSIASPSTQWNEEIHKEIFEATVGIPLALELVSNYVHNVDEVKAVLTDINRRTHPLWEYIYKQVLQQLQQDERRLLMMTMLFKSPMNRDWLRKAARFDELRCKRALTRLRYHGLLDMNHFYVHDTLREYIMSHEEFSLLMKDAQEDFITWAIGFVEANEKWEVNSRQTNTLASNLNNLIAALEMVLSMENFAAEHTFYSFGTTIAHYLHISGRWAESEKFLIALLEKSAQDVYKIKIQILLGRHYAHQEKIRLAKSYLLPALKNAESIGDETLLAEVCLRLGQTLHRKYPQEAWKYLEDARSRAAKNNTYDSVRTRVSALSYMAEIYLFRGNNNEALELLREADKDLRELEWDRVRAHHARLKAEVYLRLNDKRLAHKYYDESKRLAENGGDGRLLAWNYLGLAELDRDLEYARKAKELFKAVGLKSQIKRAQAIIDELTCS